MWIFLNDAFLSIVADPNSDRLLVRARIAGDIDRTFPGVPVTEGGGTDYRFRAWVERDTVAATLYQEVTSLAYGNFKDSVMDNARHDAYLGVWTQMMAYQRRQAAPRPIREPSIDNDDDQGSWNPAPARPA